MSTKEVMNIFSDKCGEKGDTASKKLCSLCKTAKTPLWRSGPHGPKSLCNACGIKFRKKKGSAALGLDKEASDNKKDKSSLSPSSSSSSTTAGCGGKKGNDENNNESSRGKEDNLDSKLKVRLMGLGKEMVLLKRARSPMKRQWRGKKKLGEVEQAAALLMALSCASVYAKFSLI